MFIHITSSVFNSVLILVSNMLVLMSICVCANEIALSVLSMQWKCRKLLFTAESECNNVDMNQWKRFRQ